MEHYISSNLEFIPTEYKYPVGRLDDITIHFAHYLSSEEANKKWKERTERINFDNLYVALLQSNDCSYKDLMNFDKIPMQNKVCFTYEDYPQIKPHVRIKGFETRKDVGTISYYKHYFTIRKNYDDFDYVKWFNS